MTTPGALTSKEPATCQPEMTWPGVLITVPPGCSLSARFFGAPTVFGVGKSATVAGGCVVLADVVAGSGFVVVDDVDVVGMVVATVVVGVDLLVIQVQVPEEAGAL